MRDSSLQRDISLRYINEREDLCKINTHAQKQLSKLCAVLFEKHFISLNRGFISLAITSFCAFCMSLNNRSVQFSNLF